ncbi:probable beta-tubulin polyglutamylase isoform X2 [Agrilus planipennis]|uniref:Probable beta-tubulin polyglutamylase isoform X2 n=1 Tax=Agrilus planipennis TaxID=224129 RepID=A0A7F5RC26_AGRPL|nr:probable beta-tubulin polyglutamylase isoform X2 [Agrilus planipennis]
MSDQNFVNNRKMASCDLSLSYSSKCRFSYTSWSWCPTCDKESPRRRCRSESLEPCRRKGKEMKNFSPRKYEKNREYENMDLEYENKDFRFDSCRIRSNLCELPTTYISNNCQLTKVVSECQNDYSDSSEKSSKIYENSFKSFDVRNQTLNFGNMLEKQDKDKKALAKEEEGNKSLKSINKISFSVDHVKPHFLPKSADCNRQSHSTGVAKVNSLNGFYSGNNEKTFRKFLEKNKSINTTKGAQSYQPFKNSKEVYNKLLEAEAKNAHIVNKINLIESFKNPVENMKKSSAHNITNKEKHQQSDHTVDNHEFTCSQNEEINQGFPPKLVENQQKSHLKSRITQAESRPFTSFNFSNQKTLFEKQISRFEDLKNQLENQKSLLECQKAYFDQKKKDRPVSSPPWLASPPIKTTVSKQPVKVTKTNLGNVEITIGGAPVSHDTNTYYENAKDVSNLRDKYYKEIEMLKSRMNEIREKALSGQQYRYKNDIINNLQNSTPEKKDGGLKDAVKKSVNGALLKKKDLKNVNSKVSLKTRKLNNVKLKKTKSKFLNGADSGPDSEYSDSEDCEGLDITESVQSIDATNSKNTINDDNEKGDGDNCSWPLRESLFPHIPPYIRFNMHNGEPFKLPAGRKYMKWKLTNITPVLVRNTLTNTGFRLIRKSTEWVGTWGKHMKSPMFKTLKDSQKLNHFPGTFQVGRKDRLWRNLQRLMLMYGHKEFGFIPRTYILPQEVKVLKQNWKNGDDSEKWIIKPPASARGTGIRVIHKWSQLPKKANLIVQRYISNPFLINGNKFDLRLYVLVTSFNPLRIYLYPDGLVRFASVQYSDSNKDLKDRYMHLTNYSINKLSSNYTANDDANSFQGHKWTLSKLWEYLQTRNVDTKGLWRCLQQLVIKTMISGESTIVPLGKDNMSNRYNCYELFGVDVLLDENLDPWLLEVNISPSLHSQSPLDAHVKGPMVQSLFNLAQFHVPPKVIKTGCNFECYNSKLYSVHLFKKEQGKHMHFAAKERRDEYLTAILEKLTGDDVRHLTQAEDELQVKGQFERIFPTASTHVYFQYMEPRYYNRLFDAWEHKYERNRTAGIKRLKDLCETKMHLKVAPAPKVVQSSQNINVTPDQVNNPTNVQQLEPEKSAIPHNLFTLNPVKEQQGALFNNLIVPHYQQLLPSKEGQSHPTSSSDYTACPLKIKDVINPYVATPVV